MNLPGCQSASRRAMVSLLGPAQGVGLGLAPALGDRLGEVGEHHGEPQPAGDQPGEHRRVGDGQNGGEYGADLDDQHHRVAPHDPRVELAHRVRERPGQRSGRAGPAEEPARCGAARARCGMRAESFRQAGRARGPGRNVSATRTTVTPIEHADEQRPCGSAGCPAEAGAGVCRARLPARASTSTIGRNRPSSMHRPERQVVPPGVFTVRPAKAEPLLLLAEVKA